MDIEQAFNSSYLVAVVMGLFSSMHCVGMCGSLIGTLTLSLPREVHRRKSLLALFVFHYNLGRITSYAIAGLIVGLLEQVLTLPFGEGAGHRVLQIFSGLVMVGAGLYIAGWFPKFSYIEKAGAHFWRLIEPFGRRLLPVKTLYHAFFFGMIWGWLPCGLIYSALALAATTGDSIHSALTMLAFGAGTLPAVVGVGIMTSLLGRLSRMRRFRQLAGLFLIGLAMVALFSEFYPMRIHFDH